MWRSACPLVSCLLLPLGFAPAVTAEGPGTWRFADVTASAGIVHSYEYDETKKPIEPRWICGGAAAGDYDGDGDHDLYLVGGEEGSNVLYRNRGDGTFEDATLEAGVDVDGVLGCGPLFVDLEGDGDLDLLIPSVTGAPEFIGDPAVEDPGARPKIFRNLGTAQGPVTFESVDPPTIGLDSYDPCYSPALADYDLDGDLDLFFSHWNFASPGMLWSNQGNGHFANVTATALGLGAPMQLPYTFTPNFADLDSDGWPDLLLASDFGQSRVLMNRRDGTFANVTPPTIDDENGMGATVGDVDGDGDLDWFVSSIWDPDGVPNGNWGISGNRLYRNLGPDGKGGILFEDATDAAGVREGYWGWGACLADFDNDGHLDLFHVNGFPALGASEFFDDPARFFHGAGDGTFVERSAELGIADTGQGRGVVCFDADRDGDLDVFIAQNAETSTLYRNDLPPGNHYLGVKLSGPAPNPDGVGARIWATAAGSTQMRELRAGSNFVSQDPIEAHFGLGVASRVERLRV
ncbi:MAG: CRTAC1 family protein, partial [Acidobacteriota bacterium]